MDALSFGSTVKSRTLPLIIVDVVYGALLKTDGTPPSENRWYTTRVQNNVPIFDLDSRLKPGRVNKDETECTQLEQPAACPDLNTEDSKAVFCGSCLERQFACVCHDTAVECLESFDTKDHDAGAQLAPVGDLADACQVPDVDISDIAVHPLTYDAI